MEETALYHHIGIRNVFHFNYQLTTSNFMLPAMLYWQILCIMQIFVKKKKKNLDYCMSARTQQKQLRRSSACSKDATGNGRRTSFKFFPT